MFGFKKDQERLIKFWQELDEEEAPIGSESEEECDYESGSNHCSESEENEIDGERDEENINPNMTSKYRKQ